MILHALNFDYCNRGWKCLPLVLVHSLAHFTMECRAGERVSKSLRHVTTMTVLQIETSLVCTLHSETRFLMALSGVEVWWLLWPILQIPWPIQQQGKCAVLSCIGQYMGGGALSFWKYICAYTCVQGHMHVSADTPFSLTRNSVTVGNHTYVDITLVTGRTSWSCGVKLWIIFYIKG
jgi:hypothetical protein